MIGPISTRFPGVEQTDLDDAPDEPGEMTPEVMAWVRKEFPELTQYLTRTTIEKREPFRLG